MHLHTFTFVVVALLVPSVSFAADKYSAEQRYEAVKEQTKYSGSAGFDKQHKAYRDYILEARRDGTSGVENVEPAAGDMNEKAQPEQKPSPQYNQ
ncbi:MAG: hypothetical protein H6861_00795 [Rhodospirillales bacterium]|nr:hypothetical protein [Rhodospirillales bacterium]